MTDREPNRPPAVDHSVSPLQPKSTQEQGQADDVKDIAKGAAVNVFGEILKSLKPIYLVVITRLFGAGAFGLYTLAWAVIDLVSNLGGFGLDKGLIRFLPQHRNTRDEAGAHRIIATALAIGVVVSLIATAVVYLGAPLISETIFQKPGLVPVVKVLCLAIPLLVVLKILLAATQAARIMRYTVYVRSLVEPAIWFAGALLFYYLGMRAPGLAWAHVVAIVGSVLVAGYFFSQIFSLRQCLQETTRLFSWRPLTRFSLPFSLRDPLAILISRLDIFMVAFFLPPAQVGIYAIVVEIANATRKVRHSFVPIFMPVVSDLLHHQEADRLKSSFSFVVRWILQVNIVLFAVICLFGGDILTIFGPEFGIAETSLIILCLGHAIGGVLDSSEIVLLMSGRAYLCLLDLCLLLVANLTLDLILIPEYGIMGAALGAAISLVAVNIVRVLQVYLLLHIHPFRRALLKPVVAGSIASVLALLAMQNFPQDGFWKLVSTMLLFLISYTALLIWFKREPEDKEIGDRVWQKLKQHVRRTVNRAAA